MKQPHLLKLYRHSRYLPPVDWSHNSSPTGKTQDIKNWWIKAKDELKKSVLDKREKDEYVEAVCTIISELPDVTIFSHEHYTEGGGHANPQVISNEDIISITPLRKTSRMPVAGEMACVEWIDASHNSTPATIEEVENSSGVVGITQLGFLMHKNEERVIIGGRYNSKYKKYRYLGAIPTVNITKMTVLEV